MEEKNNSSVYLLSIIGVIVIGVGIWLLLQQSDTAMTEPEPEPSLEIEDMNAPESMDMDSDDDIIPDGTELGDAAEAEDSIEIESDPVAEIADDTAVDVAPDVLEPLVVTMDSGMFFFEPNVIRAKVGQPIVVNITAKGVHDFVIDEFGVRSATPDGETTRIEFTPNRAGSFEYYCSVGSHRERGQVGTLVVEN